mmetsp:Transcript_49387/g.152315  ORF Transcript_49387/g.152315 Transcript_49387/m.152315 type:complete len:260 (-) Transcript_49387:179-958(-)
MAGALDPMVEGALQHPELHRLRDLLRPLGVLPVVHLLQRLEQHRCAREVPVCRRHPADSVEVDPVLHARVGRFAGLGCHTPLLGPTGHGQTPGPVLLLRRPGLHPGVRAAVQAQPLAVLGLRAPLLVAGVAAERRHLLLGLHRALEPHGHPEGARAGREVAAIPAALEDPDLGAVGRDHDPALPDLQPLAGRHVEVEAPVALDRRRVAWALPVRPRGHDVPLGPAQVLPEVRLLDPDQRARARDGPRRSRAAREHCVGG